MSLLEDVFLEDEAGEAQELERIIEGDEYEERTRPGSDSDGNSEREDEAEEDKRRVDPASSKTKRVVKNPRFVLNPARLTGPRGISVIPEHFKDFKFKGKGHEKDDLDLILKKLEHWAYRLYPKFKFEDCLKKIETLGKKRAVSVHLHKIRSDQLITEDTVVQKDSSDEETLAVPLPEEDEFDQLLQQQIELARNTPAHGDMRPGFSTPAPPKRSPLMTPVMPKATSSPSISDEQRERMIRNRKLAEERRLARLNAASLTTNSNTDSTVDLTNGVNNINEETIATDDVNNVNNETKTKRNRSNVIDSSDDDDNETRHEAVIVHIHKTVSQNTVDLTNGYQPQNSNNVTNSGSISRMDEDSVVATINLAVDIDASETGNTIDLTNIQGVKSSFTNNEMNMETNVLQNDYVEVIMSDTDIDHTKARKENVIDLTEILVQTNTAAKTDIQNKSRVLDSSDYDGNGVDLSIINEAVTVDVHKRSSDDISEGSNKHVSSEANGNETTDITKDKSSIPQAEINVDANERN